MVSWKRSFAVVGVGVSKRATEVSSLEKVVQRGVVGNEGGGEGWGVAYQEVSMLRMVRRRRREGVVLRKRGHRSGRIRGRSMVASGRERG